MPADFPKALNLLRGIRPEARYRTTNEGFLETLKGLRPSEQGLYRQTEITPVVAKAQWPFPQVLRGEAGSFLMLRDEFHDLDQTTGSSIPTGMPRTVGNDWWHMASFQDLWVMTNGDSVAYRLADQDNIKVSESVRVKTLAKFQSRLFFGGVLGNYFDQEDWIEIFDAWKNTEHGQIVYTGQSLGDNWLIWGSNLGGGILRPFLDILYALGLVDLKLTSKAKSFLLGHVETQALGLLPLGSQGTVLSMSQLRGRLIVYTADAVYAVHSTEAGPRATLVHPSGILNRDAVAASVWEHIFIDTNKIMWRLDDDAPRRIGHSEQVTQLASPKGWYDYIEKEAHFSDGKREFVVGPGGTSESSTVTTNAIRVSGGGLMGDVVSSSEEFSLTTGVEDMNAEGVKSISFVEVAYSDIKDLRLDVSFRYESSSEFFSMQDIPASGDGKFYTGITAKEFKFTLRGTAGPEAKMEKAVVRFEYADSSTVRGPRSSDSVSRV